MLIITNILFSLKKHKGTFNGSGSLNVKILKSIATKTNILRVNTISVSEINLFCGLLLNLTSLSYKKPKTIK